MMPLLNVLSAVFVRVVCVARAGVKILLSAAMGVTNVLPTFGSGGYRISNELPTHTHTFEDLKKSHISIFICVLQSFLLDLSGPHVLTFYLHSNILSMYSIHRMRGNRNQSHNYLNFSSNKLSDYNICDSGDLWRYFDIYPVYSVAFVV